MTKGSDQDDRSNDYSHLTLPVRKVVCLLAGVAIALICIHLALFAVQAYTGHGRLLGIIDRFDLDQENNIPTWYSMMLLLIASGYAYAISCTRSVLQLKWRVMALLLLGMSIDEVASIHETANIWAPRIFGDGWNLGFIIIRGWTDIGAIVVALVALYFVSFVSRLPSKTRNLLICGALAYVCGAIVVESLLYTGLNVQPYGYTWHIVVAVEEGLEMLGVITAIYALADYAQKHAKGLVVRLDS
jgi:hypothetical protein